MVGSDKRELKGVYPAMITAFDGSGNIHEAVQRQIIEYQIQAGVHGFYVCGGTGEGLLLRVDERKRLLEIALDQVKGRGAVVAHIGAYQTQDTLELARHAGEAGADAISCLPPTWFYKPDANGLVEYYRLVAGASDLPLLVYNIPQRTGLQLTPRLMDTLMTIGNVVGLKHSTGNLYEMRQIINAGKGKVIVFMGEDEYLLPALMYGAVGGIGGCYNVMPRYYVEIYEAFVRGEYQKAAEVQMREIEVASVFDDFEFIACMKETVRLMGFDCGSPRSPNRPLSEEERTRLRTRLEQIGFFEELCGSRASSGQLA